MALYEPLIDSTYFTGEFTIGQLEQQAVQDELMYYIRMHEYNFLTALLGKALYEAFYAGMQGTTVDERWQRMAYGISFVLDASLVKTGVQIDGFGNSIQIPRFRYEDKMNVNYHGLLKRANSTTDTEFVNDGYGAASPIAKYIYYWWMRSHVTASGGATESAQQVHNGTAVINNQKMIRAYNEMCVEVFQFYLFLDMNIVDYPEFELEPNARYCPKQINEFNFL